jgi:hypothetical protein
MSPENGLNVSGRPSERLGNLGNLLALLWFQPFPDRPHCIFATGVSHEQVLRFALKREGNRLKRGLAVALLARLKLGYRRNGYVDPLGKLILRQSAMLPPFLDEVAAARLALKPRCNASTHEPDRISRPQSKE